MVCAGAHLPLDFRDLAAYHVRLAVLLALSRARNVVARSPEDALAMLLRAIEQAESRSTKYGSVGATSPLSFCHPFCHRVATPSHSFLLCIYVSELAAWGEVVVGWSTVGCIHMDISDIGTTSTAAMLRKNIHVEFGSALMLRVLR